MDGQHVYYLEGSDELMKKLDALKPDNPRMNAHLKTIMRTVMRDARKEVADAAKKAKGSDPRKAYKAVRHSAYKRVLGGQVNIFSSRKVTRMSLYRKKGKLRPGQAGGNRWPRGAKTKQMDAYEGKDRGFVLRWLSEGTQDRYIMYRENSKDMRLRSNIDNKYGKRGRIQPRHFFAPAATKAVAHAAEAFQKHVADAMEKAWTGKEI